MGGWIKLHRKLLDSAIFDNPRALKVWVWCLLRANHKRGKVMVGHQLVELEPGEFITGSHRASEELEIPVATLWRYLDTLEELGMVERKSENKYTVLKVVNWGIYQGKGEENGKQMETKRKANGNQTETNKNVKNVKNDKKIKDIWSHYCSTFKGIYNARKLNKKRKGHINARLESFSFDEIKKAVSNIRKSDWHIGDNPDNKVYATPEFIFRNDEKIEEWLNYEPEEEEEIRDLSQLREEL